MRKTTTLCRMAGLVLGLVGLVCSSHAQVFTYKTADLCVGFRQNSQNYSGTNEDVFNAGQASNYVALSIGTTITVSNLAPSQLVPWSLTSFQNLQVSVTAYYLGTAYPGYPVNTLWMSVPRANVNVQSTPPTRLASALQQQCKNEIEGILLDAKDISQALVVSNQFNTPWFIQEPDSYGNQILSVHMGDLETGYTGTLQDTWPNGNLEITTPNAFSGSVRSDLYEVRPLTDGSGNPINDPHVGTNSGAYFVGYFTFTSSGALTFTRAASTSPAPPAPNLTISRTGTTSTISFASSSGATYTLYYTNTAGLTQPISGWPTNSTTISGDGTTHSFMDTSSDTNRFYRVSAH